MTTPKAKLAGLALIAALCGGFTLGLTAPAWAEEVSDRSKLVPYTGNVEDLDLVPVQPKPFKVTCYQGGEKIISLDPVFNAGQNKYRVQYEKADGTTGIIRKGANTTCNVEPVEPKFWEGWKIWEGWGQ